MTSERDYPGYEELTSYLTRSRDKSFWGFLRRCRDTIVATTSATSCCEDLEGDWIRNFLSEAEKLGEDLKGKVDSERRRYAKDFENYWNNVISECKIKKDILHHKAEISRLQRKLSEIQENEKMQNPSNQKDLVNEGPDDRGILIFDDGDDNINNDDNGNIDNVGEDNEDPDDHDILMFNDGDDNINNDDNGNIDNIGEDNDTISSSSPAVATSTTITNNNCNDNTTISPSSLAVVTTTPSSLAVVTTTPSEPYNLRRKRPINYNYGHVTKKRKKNKSSPLTQPSRQLSPRQPSPLSQPSRQVPSQQSSPRQPSHNDFNFFDDVSGSNDDNNECTGGCPKHCRDD